MKEGDSSIRIDERYWRKVRHRDLCSDPLWSTVCDLVKWKQGQESFEAATLRTARTMPRGLRYYFLIMSLDGQWGNGGMQAVVLTDDPTTSRELVTETAKALRFHGSNKKAEVLKELNRVTAKVEPALRKALDRNAPESEVQPLWDRIDAFDDAYDKADPEVDVYASIVKHAHAHPEEYVPKGLAE